MRVNDKFYNEYPIEAYEYAKDNNLLIVEIGEENGQRVFQIQYPPEMNLIELKEYKKQEINQVREQARLDEGATYNDDLFDIDAQSQANITAILSMLTLNTLPEGYTTVYRSKTNINHAFTVKQMVELGTAIGNKVTEIYQKSWDLKNEVDKATTKEEVEAITW